MAIGSFRLIVSLSAAASSVCGWAARKIHWMFFPLSRSAFRLWSTFSCADDCQVLIRFSKMVAQNVAEVAWHKTQQLTFREDGRLDFRATVSGLGEISWWVLGYGDQAEVLEPAQLRRIVAERAAHMARCYRGKGKST